LIRAITDKLKGFLLIAVTILLLCAGCGSQESSNQVLIVIFAVSDESELESESESERLKFTKEAIDRAFLRGGTIDLSTNDLDKYYPLWSIYGAMSEDNMHYLRGTMINFISSKGWEIHSINELSQNVVFTKKRTL
jgi:hypothetical protein